MATNAPGVNGALFDPSTANGLGALSTLIGFGTNSALVTGLPNHGFAQGWVPIIHPIGFVSPVNAQACGFAGKALKFNVAATPVNNGAAFADTYVNRSGVTCPAGSGVFSVAP